MPDDVREYVLLLQGQIKSKKKLGKYSQQQTIITIIREHKELKEKKNDSV